MTKDDLLPVFPATIPLAIVASLVPGSIDIGPSAQGGEEAIVRYRVSVPESDASMTVEFRFPVPASLGALREQIAETGMGSKIRRDVLDLMGAGLAAERAAG